MADENTYDAAVIGGGLAGLCLSIQLAKAGHRVILFEKEQYPFHKVCGEYISLESRDFLEGLGTDLNAMRVSAITKLQVSSVTGKTLDLDLPLGGFGISRHLLDASLAMIARSSGVMVKENCKVHDIVFKGSSFDIDAAGDRYHAKVCCGSFGKRSNLDVKWKRPFAQAADSKLNNYIGIKYHIRSNFPADTIALHNFKNGYCGIVKIEADKYCLCYLTTANNLKKQEGSIAAMEKNILSKNPLLKEIFQSSEMLYEAALSISQISFDRKEQVKDHILMIGDAAGMITPLCGNGMSMAMHGSKLAAEQVDLFLNGHISREKMEGNYTLNWQQQFSRRLQAGRRIQRLFGNSTVMNMLLAIAKIFPSLGTYLIKKTHGKPF